MKETTNKRVGLMHLVLNLQTGGLEHLVVDTIRCIDETKYRPILCTLQDSVSESLHRKIQSFGIKLIRLKKRNVAVDLGTIQRLAQTLKKEDVTILHTHNWIPLFYGSFAAAISRTPIKIHTKHGSDISTSKSIVRILRRCISVTIDKCIAVSDDVKNALRCGYGFNPRKIVVVKNGIDTKRHNTIAEGSRELKRAEMGVRNGTHVIGIVARLSDEKDHLNLLRSIPAVVSSVRGKDFKLVIVGDGPCRENLIGTVRQLQISKKVIFLGDRSDVPELMNAFDTFILSSVTEGISLTLLEAMATGLPVVATNVGGNPEVVVDGVTGILVPPKDPEKMAEAIIRLLQNRELAKQMGDAGRKRVEEKFSLERMVREYENIYEECLIKKEIR